MTVTALAASRTFASLRNHRNYRLFFTGQVVSVSGTWMQNIVLYWLVVSATKSPIAVGVLSIARFGPFTLFSLFVGTIVDRFDQRRLVMLTQATQLALSLILAVLTLSGDVTIWQVDLIAFLGGVVLVLDSPSRQGLTFQMVGRDELPNAVALNSTLFNVGRLIGPSIAGVMIGAVGIGWCFVVNSASFLAVLASLLLMHVAELFPLDRPERPKLWAGTREGLAFVRNSPTIISVLITTVVFSSLLFNVNVLLPLLTKHTLHGGPRAFGLLASAYGAGALIGALTTATLGRPSWRIASGAATVYALASFIVAPLDTVWSVALVLFVAGIFLTIYNSTVNTLVQLAAPDHIRGRIVSVYMYSSNGFVPLGSLLIAWVCDIGGTELAYLVLGLCGLAAVSWASWWLRHAQARKLRVATAAQAVAQ